MLGPADIETMAKAAHLCSRIRHAHKFQVPAWESAGEELREDWRATMRAAVEAIGLKVHDDLG